MKLLAGSRRREAGGGGGGWNWKPGLQGLCTEAPSATSKHGTVVITLLLLTPHLHLVWVRGGLLCRALRRDPLSVPYRLPPPPRALTLVEMMSQPQQFQPEHLSPPSGTGAA